MKNTQLINNPQLGSSATLAINNTSSPNDNTPQIGSSVTLVTLVTLVVNRGLALIGQEGLLSLEDNSPIAHKVSQIWGEVHDSVLRAYNWKSCARRQSLVSFRSESLIYPYQFALPDDFIRLIELSPSTARYQIEGRSLLATSSSVGIVYVSRNLDISQYDPLLREALAYKLASELAFADTASTSLAKNLEQAYQERLRMASALDSSEGDAPIIHIQSSWVAAHRGYFQLLSK